MKKNETVLVLTILGFLVIIAAGMVVRSNPGTLPALTPTATATTDAPAILSSTSVSAVTPVPEAESLTRLAWFYKPPEGGKLDFIADRFDFFILTHKDENELAELRDNGLKYPVSQYLLLLVIEEPDDCDEEPSGNQVAWKAGDFCMISEQHPDWFLLDESGKRIQSGRDSYFMDPGNEGFRAFWLERARELQESYGWDNIFLDNVEASIFKMTDGGRSVALYPDDASFQRAVEGFLQYIRSNYFAPRGKPVYGNIVSVRDEQVWDRYMQHLDGVMSESFATDWEDGYPELKEWEAEMTQLQQTLSRGKTLILVAQGDEDDLKLQAFSFASYLLLANDNTFFRYTNSESYREIWMYPNYDLDLGKPLGDRYPKGNVWRRDFENGYVTVNPRKHQAEIVVNP